MTFEEWKKSLPNCIGFEGGCDGDLVATEHEPNCPMYGKELATMEDAWTARDPEVAGLTCDKKVCEGALEAYQVKCSALTRELEEARAAYAALAKKATYFISADDHYFHSRCDCEQCDAIEAILHTPNPGTALLARIAALEKSVEDMRTSWNEFAAHIPPGEYIGLGMCRAAHRREDVKI